MTFEIRRAVAEDAAGIARVHIQAWRETYTRMVEPGELDELSEERRAERWRQIMEGGVQVWVASNADQVVGFASSSPGADDAPRPVSLEAIYLLADQHGSGAGQALLDAALGDAPAYLFVAADNPRATRFYERNGFKFDGESEQYPLVRTPITSLRMVR
ncbi:MAG: GNAT family N-acetyltransferase [Pseudolysinimonas sp.]